MVGRVFLVALFSLLSYKFGMSLCKSCGDSLPAEEDYVKCINSCTLHYTCSGLAEKTWRQWAKAKRETYRCILCRNSANDNNSVKSVDSQQDVHEASNTKCIPLSEDLIEAIEKSVERAVNAVLGTKINNLMDQINGIEESVTFCSNKVDDFVKQLNSFF